VTPEQRDRLTRLLAAELLARWHAAVAAGAAPEELAALLAERRRRLEAVADRLRSIE